MDDPRERILAGAERCIGRYGIRKTTMEDIASEVGISRPSVYRYFSDRDDLLIELITRHARKARDGTHKFISRQASLSDQIVEGLLYNVDRTLRDPVMRYIIDPEGNRLGRRMIASRAFEILVAEFWDPFLDAAYVNNELPRDVPRSDIYLWLTSLSYLWLTSLSLMLMRGLEDGAADLNRYRSVLRRFVAPAFAASQA